MKEGLLTAWRLNNEKNRLLLNSLTGETLALRSTPKGRSTGEQMAHLHNNRIQWTEFVAKNLYDKNLLLPKSAALTVAELLKAFDSSARKIDDVIHASWEKDGKLPSFKTGLIPFVTYLVSHESHHRGNVLLTLKQNGVPLSDELRWGLWEWAK